MQAIYSEFTSDIQFINRQINTATEALSSFLSHVCSVVRSNIDFPTCCCSPWIQNFNSFVRNRHSLSSRKFLFRESPRLSPMIFPLSPHACIILPCYIWWAAFSFPPEKSSNTKADIISVCLAADQRRYLTMGQVVPSLWAGMMSPIIANLNAAEMQ